MKFDFKEERLKLCWSIRAAANAIGISTKALCEIENMKKKPAAKTVYNISKAYNMPLGIMLHEICGTKPHTLRWYREMKGLTLGNVADKIGVSLKTVYTWEKGEYSPNSTKREQLCEIYGICEDDLDDALICAKNEFMERRKKRDG